MKRAKATGLLVLALAVPAVASAGHKQAAFSVTISTSSNVAKAGSKITVLITLTNTSNNDISIYQSLGSEGEFEYAIDLRQEGRKSPAEREYLKAVKGHQTDTSKLVVVTEGGFLPVKPGKTMEDSLDLNKLYDLDEPGKYTIQVSRFEDESSTWVKSNTLKLTVTP